VYLTNGAVLAGFTLTNGATQSSGDSSRNQSGGGVWCEGLSGVVSNCVLTGNAANYSGGGAYFGTLSQCVLTGNSATYGGGANAGTLNHCALTDNSARFEGGGTFGGMLNNCVLTGNSATNSGGGANVGTLNNCTLTGNSANYGGGANGGTLTNCIVYYNDARYSGANYSGATFNHCCTIPLPAGAGNLTNAPSFVDTNHWGNLRLQTNSPPINAGNDAAAPGPTDLDGNPRIIGGRVDMGAYEYTNAVTSNGVPWEWLVQYGLPIDGSADFEDPDGDHLNTWQEWQCDTDPTNALSVLRLLTPLADGANRSVSWASVTSRVYSLERSSTVNPGSFQPLATNLAGQSGVTTFIDTNAASAGPSYYRVRVP
jgi:hypothetical protein